MKKGKLIIASLCVFIILTGAILAFLFREDIFGNSYDNINENVSLQVKPDTWAAVDGLGRTLPTAEETGGKNSEKFVGLFYWTWHYHHSQNRPARNVTQLLNESPAAIRDFDAPVWQNTESGTPHYWNEPLFGYYTNLDEYVVRKHAELIADAGVDVIIFDCTNQSFVWEEGYETLFKVFEEARDEGVNVPQVAFMLPFSGDEYANESLHKLYDNIYSKGRYKDLWFMWDEKPLIMAHSSALDKKDAREKEILDFFTFRANESVYFVSDTRQSDDRWGWCSVYPQTRFGVSLFGGVEQMCVSVAQNAADGKLVAMNADADVQGRSYTEGEYSYSYEKDGQTVTVNADTENKLLYGLNFQQQWDRVFAEDPDFVFVTGWNEWLAGRFDEWQGTENAFPDQFNDEYSRDIEPSKGILADHYYYQLVANIRRFKGMDKDVTSAVPLKIDIFADDSKWDEVETEYFHYINSTRSRNSDSWQGIHYENDTMRNDFRSIKVTYDDENVYFRIETVNDITSYTDKAWMRLFIDTDVTGKTPSWEGFEYVINRENATENEVIIEKSEGGWHFVQCGTGKYRINKNIMYLQIPRSALELNGDGDVHFNFKLSDNMQNDGDILDFYQNGDVAPGGRFMFVF